MQEIDLIIPFLSSAKYPSEEDDTIDYTQF